MLCAFFCKAPSNLQFCLFLFYTKKTLNSIYSFACLSYLIGFYFLTVIFKHKFYFSIMLFVLQITFYTFYLAVSSSFNCYFQDLLEKCSTFSIYICLFISSQNILIGYLNSSLVLSLLKIKMNTSNST